MANKIFNFIEIETSKLSTQIRTWLKSTFGTSDAQFSDASPHGQLITLQEELNAHQMLYLKNVTNRLILQDDVDAKVVQSKAIIAGHKPARPTSATGVLRFRVKPSINIEEFIKGGYISINNYHHLKNKTNNLSYSLETGVEKLIQPINLNSVFYINIIQGRFETQSNTGDGSENQSFTVLTTTTSNIDNNRVNVKYNGLFVEVKDGFIDLLTNELACYTNTAMEGGIDVFFGNGYNGFIPESASQVDITYLLTNGSDGEIINPIANDFKFIEDVYDAEGNVVSMDEVFDIEVDTVIGFASDGETKEMTAAILPYSSRNFVLATPKQFIYHLKRLNRFSKINAYNKLDDNLFNITEQLVMEAYNKLKKAIDKAIDKGNIASIKLYFNQYSKLFNDYRTNLNDNQIYLYLIPLISKYFNSSVNYFNVPLDVFYLDDEEKEKTINYLRDSATISPNIDITIIQPKLSKYTVFYYISRKANSNVNNDSIKQLIINETSNFLLTYDRTDRIVKSDLINYLKTNIVDIDSLDLHFKCEKNENAKKSATFRRSNKLIGIDEIVGDIVIEKDEYAIIRGDWRDSSGNYYSDELSSNGLKAINIEFIK